MRSLPVVVVHQIATNIFLGLRQIPISEGRYPLRFQTSEQPLHRGIVPAIATPAHALGHSIAPEPLTELATGILTSLIRVEHNFLWLTALFPGVVQSFDDQIGVRAGGHRPTDNTPGI